jgi:hypothetical protein
MIATTGTSYSSAPLNELHLGLLTENGVSVSRSIEGSLARQTRVPRRSRRGLYVSDLFQ